MSKQLRSAALDRLCDALGSVAPTAPTLCEGWTAHDLAIHVWVITHDAPSWPGDVIPALVPYSAERAERVRSRWRYHDLVRVLRAGSGAIGCMPLDALEGYRHAIGEYTVHTHDVAAPNGLELELPAPTSELENALWRRARPAALALHTRKTPGLVLRREDGTQMQVTPGRARTRVTGRPSELLYWVYGRPADVTVESI